VARLGSILPQTGIFQLVDGDRLFDEPIQQRRQRRVLPHDPRIGQDRFEAQHHFAVHVVLALHVGRIADADRPRALVAAQLWHDLFVKIALAGDSVQRLKRTGVGHIAKKPHERLTLRQMTQAPQCFDHERGVAQPAEPVVPGPRRVERLGKAGRGGGDDRASVVVGVEFQA
jgi:hypothetical protein